MPDLPMAAGENMLDSQHLEESGNSPLTLAKLENTILKHKDVSIAPSDGDVPRNDRSPSKTAFFDGDVPFFCRPPSLRPRKPSPSPVKGKYPLLFRAQSTKTARRSAICAARGIFTPIFAVRGTSHFDVVKQ